MNEKDKWEEELKREFRRRRITDVEEKKAMREQILEELKSPVFYVNFCYQYDAVIELNERLEILNYELALCNANVKKDDVNEPKYVREGFLWLRKRELKKEKIEQEIKECEEKIEEYGSKLGIRQTNETTSTLGAIFQE